MLPGLIVGAIIRYGGTTNHVTYINVHPANDTTYNMSVPPDMLRLHFPDKLHVSSGGKDIRIYVNLLVLKF